MKPYYDDGRGIVIYHGDCREIIQSFAGLYAVVTDPPYGMDYDTDGSRFTLGGRSLPRVYGDKAPFDPKPWMEYPSCVLWGFNHFPTNLPPGGSLVWIKRSDAAFGQFLSDCEVAWVKGIQGVYAFRNIRHAIAERRVHPTEKPVDLMAWSILQGTEDSDAILDPFMGSGTTLRAAKDLGRKAIGIEIEEKYCEIAVRRLAQEVLL